MLFAPQDTLMTNQEVAVEAARSARHFHEKIEEVNRHKSYFELENTKLQNQYHAKQKEVEELTKELKKRCRESDDEYQPRTAPSWRL